MIRGLIWNRFKQNKKKKILFEKPSGIIDLYKNNNKKKKYSLGMYANNEKKNESFLANMSTLEGILCEIDLSKIENKNVNTI